MIESVNTVNTVNTHPAVLALRQAVDELLMVDLDGLSDAALLRMLQDLETQRRRLPAVDHALTGPWRFRGVTSADKTGEGGRRHVPD